MFNAVLGPLPGRVCHSRTFLQLRLLFGMVSLRASPYLDTGTNLEYTALNCWFMVPKIVFLRLPPVSLPGAKVVEDTLRQQGDFDGQLWLIRGGLIPLPNLSLAVRTTTERPGSSDISPCQSVPIVIPSSHVMFNHMPSHRVFNNLGKCKLDMDKHVGQ